MRVWNRLWIMNVWKFRFIRSSVRLFFCLTIRMLFHSATRLRAFWTLRWYFGFVFNFFQFYQQPYCQCSLVAKIFGWKLNENEHQHQHTNNYRFSLNVCRIVSLFFNVVRTIITKYDFNIRKMSAKYICYCCNWVQWRMTYISCMFLSKAMHAFSLLFPFTIQINLCDKNTNDVCFFLTWNNQSFSWIVMKSVRQQRRQEFNCFMQFNGWSLCHILYTFSQKWFAQDAATTTVAAVVVQK